MDLRHLEAMSVFLLPFAEKVFSFLFFPRFLDTSRYA